MLGLPLAELLESDVKKSQRSAVHCSAQCCKECDSLASDLEVVHAPVGFAAELGLADTCPFQYGRLPLGLQQFRSALASATLWAMAIWAYETMNARIRAKGNPSRQLRVPSELQGIWSRTAPAPGAALSPSCKE